MALLLLLSSLTAICFIYTASRLVKNVRAAQKSGLPYTVLPTTFFNSYYSVLLTFKNVRYILNYWLPQSLSDAVNNTDNVGRWTVKDRMFQRHGSCYLRISPSQISLDVSDANVMRQVFNNRHLFEKPVHLYGELEFLFSCGRSIMDQKSSYCSADIC